MPAGSKYNARAIALALALGVNALFLLLLLSSHGAPPALRQGIRAMIWIAPAEAPPPRPPPRQLPAARVPARIEAPAANPVQIPPPLAVVAPPARQSPQDTAIDLPQVDWHEAASKAVQEQLRKQEELARRNRLLKSDPEVLDLPKDRGVENGRVEHFEGGVRMHIDGDCVTTTNPQAMQPWALDRVERFFGGSASAKWSSKSGGCRADQTSSKRAEALEKAVKPRYLGGTRPLPEEDESSSAIKIP
jgi:hypothetical protein